MAEDWLWDCDHVLANAIEEHKGPRSDTVARLISTMAFKIARCHTNMSPCRNEFPIGSNSFFTNEKLTYVRLGLEGTRAAELLEREGMQYILRISCMQTPQKTRNDILSHGTGAIQAFLSSISKYITVDDQQKLNLPFAARMAFDHVPLVVKVEISARWAFEHGAEARRIIESACLYSKNCPLSRDESIVSDRLSSMVQLTSDSKGKALPAISWTQSRFSQINVLVAPDETLACNMGTETLRCLRIITMVQKMGDIGFFSQGIVSKEILRPACLEMQVHARMAMEILHQSKLRLNRGVSLLIMLQFVSDRCSDAATMMDRALCSLSRFPMAYLNYISNPKSTGFSQRLQDISQAMRCIGGRGANITYPRLALDTLKIVLPILHDRRSALGIGSHNPSSAMREMLRLVRGTRTVQIKKEMYVSLKLKNIRAAHPALEFALDSLARTHPNVVSTHYMSLDSANHKNTKPKWKARERKWEKQTPSVFIHAHHFQSLVSVNPKNVC
jgi:hypothetical protein